MICAHAEHKSVDRSREKKKKKNAACGSLEEADVNAGCRKCETPIIVKKSFVGHMFMNRDREDVRQGIGKTSYIVTHTGWAHTHTRPISKDPRPLSTRSPKSFGFLLRPLYHGRHA